MSDVLHRLTIITDSALRPVGAVVTAAWDEAGGGHHTPLDVGPFDTLAEVLERCAAMLDRQLTLW